jgi:hypothetical protein
MKHILVLLFTAVLISSCGGGSGSSSEPTKPVNTPTLKLQKSILYFQGTENGVSSSYKEEILLEVENQKGTVYVAAKNNNPELVERIYLPIINNPTNPSLTLTLYVAQPFFTGLKKGTHQGSITLLLCEDSECAKPIPNSTATINIVYDVL